MSSFRAPSQELVREALRRIPTPQLRSAFFEGLKNPLWIAPLVAEGIFTSPPEPVTTDDGLVRDVYWPEINYLVRVAPEAAEEVIDILLSLESSNNAWVRRAVFTVGSSAPPAQAARLKPLLKSWIASGFGWRSDPREMVGLAVNLLGGGESKTGRWVANALFRPTPSEQPKKPRLALDEYWYARGLSRLIQAVGAVDGLMLVLPWLEQYERLQGHLNDSFDVTYLSREAIRSSGGLGAHDKAEQALIDAVRDLSIGGMDAEPELVRSVLVERPIVIVRRIALFANAEALRKSEVGSNLAALQLAVASKLLSDDESRDDACRIEYGELARAVAGHSTKLMAPFIDFIAAGPLVGLDVVRERLQRDDDEDSNEIDDQVEQYLERWRHRWLSAVGMDSLPEVLKTSLQALDAELGVIDDPLDPAGRVTSWTGPSSPVSQDDMTAMSPTELVNHLESWHDEGDGWGPEPSHEGQGRELTNVLTTNPMAVRGVHDLVDRLRPTYLRAILSGWDAALKSDIELDWLQVVEVTGGVLTHAEESEFPVEGGNWDDDLDFRSAKQAAVSLLADLARKRDDELVPLTSLDSFAELLIGEAADSKAWSEYDGYEQPDDMEPLNVSINWQWPIRLRGIMNLLFHGTQASWYTKARSAFELEIRRPDRRGASRAVVGEGIGRLLSVDPDWIEPQMAELFGAVDNFDHDQQIALTTAIAVHNYYNLLFDQLRHSFTAAIRAKEPLSAGWRSHADPLQIIGEWIVSAVILGHIPVSDPLAVEYFTTVDPAVRGEAIGNIAWGWMHANAVEADVRDRLGDLWDLRVAHVRGHSEDAAELNSFHWFVQSDKFDPHWWLPRLKEAAALAPGLGSGLLMIGRPIAVAADVDPRGALEAMMTLMKHRESDARFGWDLAENALAMVIGRAMASGNGELEKEAVGFMNWLGERGHTQLETLVKSVSDGTLTQADIVD